MDDRTAALELGVTTPVIVTYAASIALNAALGSLFRVTATGNLTVTDITGGTNGQQIVLEVLASGGARTLTVAGSPVTVQGGEKWAGTLRFDAGRDEWLLSAGSGAVTSVNSRTGNVVLTASDVGAQAADIDLTGLAGLDNGVPVKAGGVWAAVAPSELGGGNLLVLDYIDAIPGGTADGTVVLRRAPTVVTTALFTGTNGTTLGSPWTLSGGGTGQIQSNTLRLTTATGAYVAERAILTGVIDGEILVRFKLSTTAEQYPTIGFRRVDDANHYIVALSATAVMIGRVAGGTFDDQDTAAVTIAAGDWWWARVRWVGQALSARVWADGTTEPAAWTVTTTDNGLASAGTVHLAMGNGGAGGALSIDYDDFTLMS
jgi:hypothetical protein